MTSGHPVDRYLDLSHRIGQRLLSVLADVCETRGIEFYVYAGTMLGAVRESGWIPWDDDVDVVMFRSEFERFRVVCGDLLPADVAFSDHRSQPSHLSSMAHLLFLDSRKGSYARPRKAIPPETVHVHLDIFILDTTPKSRCATLVWRQAIRVIEKLIHAHAVSWEQALRAQQHSKVAAVTVVAVSRCLPSSGWRRLYHAVCVLPARFSGGSSVAVMNDFHQQNRKIIMTRDDFRPAASGGFEDLRVPLPARANDILRRVYGPDFMQRPRYPSERQPAHVRNGLVAIVDGVKWRCAPLSQRDLSTWHNGA